MQQSVKTVLTRAEIAQTSKGPIFKTWDQYGTEYATFQQSIWEQARVLLNQPATIVYDSSPSKDGRFENRYLQSVEADGASQVAQPAFAQMPPVTGPVEAVYPVPAVPAQPEYQRAKHPEEQRAIRRAVALQCAVQTVPHLEVFQHPDQVLAVAANWEAWLAQ
jgi:hypothetical protein